MVSVQDACSLILCISQVSISITAISLVGKTIKFKCCKMREKLNFGTISKRAKVWQKKSRRAHHRKIGAAKLHNFNINFFVSLKIVFALIS